MASSFALSTKPRRVRRWRYVPRRKRSQPKTWNLNDSARACSFCTFREKDWPTEEVQENSKLDKAAGKLDCIFREAELLQEPTDGSKDVRRSILKQGSKRSPTNHLRIRFSQDGETFIQPRDPQGPLWRIVQICSRIRPQSQWPLSVRNRNWTDRCEAWSRHAAWRRAEQVYHIA